MRTKERLLEHHRSAFSKSTELEIILEVLIDIRDELVKLNKNQVCTYREIIREPLDKNKE